jgi:hypothetical protein
MRRVMMDYNHWATLGVLDDYDCAESLFPSPTTVLKTQRLIIDSRNRDNLESSLPIQSI